jgi:cytoskeletal protein CcmA (bactofilin family)
MKRLALLGFLLAFAGGASADFITDRIRAGCPIHVDEPVDGDVVIAGCEAKVDARVDGKLRMAGAEVQVGPNAVVTGDASIAGAEVVVKGTVEGDLHAAGGDVRIDGTIDGDARVGAASLTLGPNAKIGGKLRYRAADFNKDDGATVAGGITTSRRGPRHASFDIDGWDRHGHSTLGWIWTVTLMIFAGALAALLPGFSGRVSEELRSRPGLTLLFGFIAFACIPVAAVMLMVTVIGIPIGVLAILGYAGLLLLGYVATAVVLGGLLLDRINAANAGHLGWRALAAVGVMLAIAIVGRVPVLGHFVVFAALLVGVGAIVAAVARGRGQSPTPATN